MKQFYVIEIQQTQPGVYAYLVHSASNENERSARLQAESIYHQVLASAAISELPSHAAVLVTGEGVPIMNNCYYNYTQEEPQEEEE